MRRIASTVAFLVLVFAASACGDDDAGATAGADPWGRTFLSTDVSRELVEDSQIRLEFVDGEVRATAGCNHLMGAASLDGDQLVVDNVGGTEMGCDAARHEQDDWLAVFLQGRPTLTLDAGTLTLDDGTDTIVLVDREIADPDRPLEGTEWVVNSIVDGDAVSSVPGAPQAEAWLRFQDGRIEGHDGCNSFGGDAEVGERSVALHDVVATLIGCVGDKGELADAVGALLHGTVSFEIEADQLRLTAADGAGLVLHAREN